MELKTTNRDTIIIEKVEQKIDDFFNTRTGHKEKFGFEYGMSKEAKKHAKYINEYRRHIVKKLYEKYYG